MTKPFTEITPELKRGWDAAIIAARIGMSRRQR